MRLRGALVLLALGTAALAFVITAMTILGCDSETDTTSGTDSRTPVATPHPTEEPLLHVPGTFGQSANSTSTFYNEPHFPCGPTMSTHYEHSPEVLLWTADGSDLVFSKKGTVWKVDVHGNELRPIVHALGESILVEILRFKWGFYADLSPDGTQLAYTSCQFQTEYDDEDYEYVQAMIARDGPEWYERSKFNYEIALVDLDGGRQQRITQDRLQNHYPAWSPTGNRIAFVAGQLYTMSPDGSDVHSVTTTRWFPARFAFVPPVWSPDSQRLAFVVNDGEPYPRDQRKIYTVRTDGTDLVQVGEMGGLEFAGNDFTAAPTWSPDGERLAYQGFQGEDLAIYTVRFDGSDRRLVWHNTDRKYRRMGISQVSWSPDGLELLIVGNGTDLESNDDRILLYSIDLTRGSMRPLDAQGASAVVTSAVVKWSPDSSEIAIYAGYRWPPYTHGIWLAIMNRDGTNLRTLISVNDDARFVTANLKESGKGQ